MTRVLEFIVALIIVFILAVIVGLLLPSHGYIQRSIEISHNPQHIYDVLNNFRRFQDYAGGELQTQDPNVKFTLSGPAYGPGAAISWAGNETLGNGKLVNKSGKIDLAGNSTVTWDLTNDWHGKNKVYTIQVTPHNGQRVSTVSWSFDVDYGWNLVARYSQFWIHGKPAAFIQYGLGSLQTMLAGIPNVDYGKVTAGLYQTPATPVLLVSTKATRTLDDIDSAKAEALQEVEAAMGKLGVEAAGPTTTITTNWGDTTYTFDFAVPINSTTLTIDGKQYDLTKLPPRPNSEEAPPSSTPASSSSAASSSSVASAASAGLPASGSSAAGAAIASGPAPGSLDKENQLVVNANVRATMLPAREVLEANWTGEAGVPLMRLALKAYAGTHGYQFNDSVDRLYDQLASLPSVQDSDQIYRVFLPVQNAPAQTPEQSAGKVPASLPAVDPSVWAAAGPKPAETKKAKTKKKHEARKHHEHTRKRHHR